MIDLSIYVYGLGVGDKEEHIFNVTTTMMKTSEPVGGETDSITSQ